LRSGSDPAVEERQFRARLLGQQTRLSGLAKSRIEIHEVMRIGCCYKLHQQDILSWSKVISLFDFRDCMDGHDKGPSMDNNTAFDR
jgi:hypothetical protein